MKSQTIIDRLNNGFHSFWNDYDSIPLYFKEQDLDFGKPGTKTKDHIVLVYPNLSATYRTSLGDSFNQRGEIILNVRLYTSNKLGNIPHQSVLSKILEFFPTTEIQGAYLRGSASVTGPFQEEAIRNFILSNVAAVYMFNEDKEIS